MAILFVVGISVLIVSSVLTFLDEYVSRAKKIVIELNTPEPLPLSLTDKEIQLMKEGRIQEANAPQISRAINLLVKRLRNL